MTTAIELPALCLDPALSTGWAFGGAPCQQVAYGIADLRLVGGGSELIGMHKWLVSFLTGFAVATIVYEEASQGSSNRSTAACHERIRGVIELVAAQRRIPTIAINPATWRSQFGLGRKRIAGAPMRACENLLGLYPQTDDEAVALMLLDMVRRGGYETKKSRTKRIAKKAKKAPRLFK